MLKCMRTVVTIHCQHRKAGSTGALVSCKHAPARPYPADNLETTSEISSRCSTPHTCSQKLKSTRNSKWHHPLHRIHGTAHPPPTPYNVGERIAISTINDVRGDGAARTALCRGGVADIPFRYCAKHREFKARHAKLGIVECAGGVIYVKMLQGTSR